MNKYIGRKILICIAMTLGAITIIYFLMPITVYGDGKVSLDYNTAIFDVRYTTKKFEAEYEYSENTELNAIQMEQVADFMSSLVGERYLNLDGQTMLGGEQEHILIEAEDQNRKYVVKVYFEIKDGQRAMGDEPIRVCNYDKAGKLLWVWDSKCQDANALQAILAFVK